jgi:hypothetical protein
MREQLEAFNREHRHVLESTGQALLERGIVRVHYGMDYVNDDGAPAEYAVLEYADGRVEEQDAWLEDLEYDTFLWSLRYCQPYTFDTKAARVSFDDAGGQIDTEENVIRMYHTPERLELLEVEAEAASRIEGFSLDHHDALRALGTVLEQQGITDVFFGVDETLDGYALSDWLIVTTDDGNPNAALPRDADVSRQFRETLKDFPNEIGLSRAFVFSTGAGWVYFDDEGGTHVIADGTARAYHTHEQLEALERS